MLVCHWCAKNTFKFAVLVDTSKCIKHLEWLLGLDWFQFRADSFDVFVHALSSAMAD